MSTQPSGGLAYLKRDLSLRIYGKPGEWPESKEHNESRPTSMCEPVDRELASHFIQVIARGSMWAVKPVALLCTSNGTGLGHLSRVMGVAQHLANSFDVVILTLSAAVRVPIQQGFRTEYFTSPGSGLLTGRKWNLAFQRRLAHLETMYKPDMLLFDGVHPYDGLCWFLADNRRIHSVWQRRGMWRARLGGDSIRRARYFDLVVEPGDYARAYDTGLTSHADRDVLRVNPVLYERDPLSRSTAREDLGLDHDGPVALVSFGAGNINDISSLTRRTVDRLNASGIHAAVVRSALARDSLPTMVDVSVVERFPLSRYFEAFDMAFLAGGYNSVNEALSRGLASAFIPNLESKLDDQAARTRFVHDNGYGLALQGEGWLGMEGLVERLSDPVERAEIRVRCSSLPRANGASQVASILRDTYA